MGGCSNVVQILLRGGFGAGVSMRNKQARAVGAAYGKRLSQALAHDQAGRLDEAEKLYRQALALQPGDPHAQHCLGVLLHHRGQHEEALALVEPAVAARPGAAQMWCNLAEIRRAAGQPEAAEAAARQALALQPDYPEALLNLAAALFDLKRFDEVEAAARGADRDPECHDQHR